MDHAPCHAPRHASAWLLGTLAYVSPEQATADPGVDGRADLYSLGCVLYELITGAPPFVAASAAAVLAKHLTEPPPRPSGTGVAMSPELETIVLQLLAKAPADRPAGAADAARMLRAASQAPSPGRPVQAGAADRLVAEGLKAFNQFGPAGGAAARSHFETAKVYLTRALEVDPKHARALCALGNWYHVAATNGMAPEAEALARGRELIFAALASDDLCADVHCSLGKMALYHDDDFHAAERHIRRAVELDPSEPEALRLLSIVYKILGRTEDAVEAARSAANLSPNAAPLWNTLGDALLAAGRNAEAVDALKRAISLLPGYGPALEWLERARARLGEFDLALELRHSRVRLGGQRERGDRLIQEAAAHGAAEAIRLDAKRELDDLLRQADAVGSSSGASDKVLDRVMSLHPELGEWREAMDCVERAYERRPGRLRRLLSGLPVSYRGLATDPRFARLLRVAGMEDLL